MTTTVTPTTNVQIAQPLADLRASLTGGSQVIIPGEPGYDVARVSWNLAADQHPALIVVAQTAADVAQAVRYAGAQGLSVAVKATGHGLIREADGSLLIVTAQMTEVRVDAAARTAWIGAGAKWGQALPKAQAAGLAPLLGSATDVGAVGYTLGGGMGWLARHYGLSCDSVNYFEIVTAGGELVRASAAENADLFWGLRGGGGNFGVVTGMEIRLYPVTTVYAGNLYYPVDLAREVFARYRQWIVEAPEALTSSVVLMNFPPFPELPEFLRGQSFVMVRGCYSGPAEAGEALLKRWRDWRAPLIDDFKALPFSQADAISGDPVDPLPVQTSGAWLNDLSDDVAQALIDAVLPHNGPPLLLFAEARQAGGAIARVDPRSAAFSHREAAHSLHMVGITPTHEALAAVRGHIARLKQALGAHLHGGVYLNFLEGVEARERTRQGFSAEAFGRLQGLKAKYDPRNLFSHSYDIPPQAQPAA